MGWTSFSMREPVKDWFKSSWDYENSDYEVIDSALVNRTTLYGAIRKKSTGMIFCAVYLVQWSKGYYNFSYKDMTEFSGPCEIDCPPKIFKLLTPLNDEQDPNGWAREWRLKVARLLDNRKKLSKGYVIKLPEPIAFSNGYSYQYFLRIGKRFYTTKKNDDGKFVKDLWVRTNVLRYNTYELIEN